MIIHIYVVYIWRSTCWVKISADDILKYVSYSSQKISFDILETICMKCQGLFSAKNKNNVVNLSFAELEW